MTLPVFLLTKVTASSKVAVESRISGYFESLNLAMERFGGVLIANYYTIKTSKVNIENTRFAVFSFPELAVLELFLKKVAAEQDKLPALNIEHFIVNEPLDTYSLSEERLNNNKIGDNHAAIF